MYIHSIKIGNVKIENNIFLAPMAGITDIAYREIAKNMGVGFTYTEMVSAKAIFYNSQKTEKIYEIKDEERPTAIQMFGSEPEIMGEIAKRLSKVADIIDINMGCPANKIIKNNEGSALMKDIALSEKIIKNVVKNSKVPVSIKIRKGFDDSNINAVEFAKMAQDAGVSLIAVHGRTRQELFTGEVDIDIIQKVKEAVEIPVIANGDITTPQTAKKVFDYTGVDGIMIGRGSIGNPWIFKNIKNFLENKPLLEISNEEKIKMAIKHLELAVLYKGEYSAIREMRKILFYYIKGMKNSAIVREKIIACKSAKEVEEVLSLLCGTFLL